MARLNFREQMLKVREDAIMDVVTQQLARKGFDRLSMNEVALLAGIERACLTQHFCSKEELAAEALVRMLDRTLSLAAALEAQTALTALDRVEALVRWALRAFLSGDMPSLPTHDAGLRRAVAGHARYSARVVAVSERLGGWIEAAQQAGLLSTELPPDVLLYSLFARACDPVAQMLKASGRYSDEQIIELCVAVCFRGVSAR